MSDSSGTWSEVSVAGHPCDVYEPHKVSEHGYVVLYLHGVHQNRMTDKTVFIEQFDHYGLRVIAPMAGESWWSDKIHEQFDAKLTAERHILDNILPYIQQRWNATPPQIALLGTSMGGQGALRFGYKHPKLFPVVAGISPAIDFHIRLKEGDEVLIEMYDDVEAARQDTATLHVHPLIWPRQQFFCCCPTDVRWWESSDRLRMKLYSLGIVHQCDLETEGGGHGFGYYNKMAAKAIEFVAQGLETERLRVN